MKEIITYITSQLIDLYPQDEAQALAWWIVEESTGLSRNEILTGCKGTKNIPNLQTIIDRLHQFEPIQYIFGHTVWHGLDLKVTPATLIPRPETAELVGLTDKLKAHPGALSGGQKQRVGIARAIVTNPDFIISDEATSALDPQTTIQILDLLKEINRKQGITILMITHELDAIRYSCKRMAVLEEGKITESGSVRDIFENPHSKTGELFARVFMQMQNVELTHGGGI